VLIHKFANLFLQFKHIDLYNLPNA